MYTSRALSPLTVRIRGISEGSDSQAVSYIELKTPQGKHIFGVGIDHNVNYSSILGVLNAINRNEA